MDANSANHTMASQSYTLHSTHTARERPSTGSQGAKRAHDCQASSVAHHSQGNHISASHTGYCRIANLLSSTTRSETRTTRSHVAIRARLRQPNNLQQKCHRNSTEAISGPSKGACQSGNRELSSKVSEQTKCSRVDDK